MYSPDEDTPLRAEPLDAKLDVVVRHGFIRKVFGLVACQLLVTTLIATPFVMWAPEATKFVSANPWLIVIAAVGCFRYLGGRVYRAGRSS